MGKEEHSKEGWQTFFISERRKTLQSTRRLNMIFKAVVEKKNDALGLHLRAPEIVKRNFF